MQNRADINHRMPRQLLRSCVLPHLHCNWYTSRQLSDDFAYSHKESGSDVSPTYRTAANVCRPIEFGMCAVLGINCDAARRTRLWDDRDKEVIKIMGTFMYDKHDSSRNGYLLVG